MRLRNSLILFAVLITGCATAVEQRIATNYAIAGANAQKRGDWDAARRNFARAVANAELARSAPGERAILHYEYGRSLGATCFFDKAEKELNFAHQLDKEARQPLYLSLVELARLNLDQKKFIQALSYFQQALPELDRANAPYEVPVDYADILEEYALALDGVGRNEDAAVTRQGLTQIRTANPKGCSITDRTPYGKHCVEPK